MTEFLRQLWEPIAKLTRSQQMVLVVSCCLVFLGIIGATMWGSQKEYTPLFEEQMKLEDAGKVVAKLRELNIAYKLGANSSDVRVPLADKSYILLQLAQEKTLPQARPGWQKLIDERSIFQGMTQQEFELNHVRGLQEEIEAGLVRLGPVMNAKVYIVKPKTEVFKEDQKEPTASVVLKLKAGFEITRDQIRGIRDFIVYGVEGLKAENIRITDTDARDLTRVLDDEDDMSLDKVKSAQQKYVLTEERRFERKLQTALERVFGSGRAVVRVTADMDFDQMEAIKDKVEPPVEGSTEGVKISEKTEDEEFTGKDNPLQGEPGVTSNVPPGAPSYPAPNDKESAQDYKRKGKIANYDYSRTKEKFVKDQGALKRLSVSVMLDADPKEIGSDIEEQIRSSAQATVGFSKTRGDVLSLMVIPFNRDMADRARRDLDERQRQEKQMFMIVVGLLMSIPVFLGMVYLFVRVSRARALAREEAILGEAARDAEVLRQAEESRKAKLREQQVAEWERRFQDINNFFPEIQDVTAKKHRVQDVRLNAYQYARDNERIPPDFEEMTPEEQYLYKEAFQRKTDGTLEEGLQRLGSIIGERDRMHQDDLERLKHEAVSRQKLEDRIRKLVQASPEDAVSVLRLWMEE